MCGIFGWVVGKEGIIPGQKYEEGLRQLFLLSEARGKEASGLCVLQERQGLLIKAPFRGKELIKRREFTEFMKGLDPRGTFAMGHTRMVTNGKSDFSSNNQPVVKDKLICIHNGIIVNDDSVWEKHPDMHREYQVDTEVLLALLQKNNYEENILSAFYASLKELEGGINVALLDKQSNYLLLYTNTGSLYTVSSVDKTQLLFASEKFILEELIRKADLQTWFTAKNIRQVTARTGRIIEFDHVSQQRFNDKNWENIQLNQKPAIKRIFHCREIGCRKDIPEKRVFHNHYNELERFFTVDEKKIRELRRCRKCLLPETFPGIRYDKEGVCSICNNYRKKEVLGKEQLLKELTPQQNKMTKNYDCIVPLSGGRDSCYLMHYAVKELGLKPVAYTYDWGMVTDLARRNIQRMCSELEVEHILISADIKKKRKNVQLNVKAWLKDPDLATIPLFMAGDKQFFYYAQLLKKQMRVNHILFGMNSLEETKFKVAFTGTKEKPDRDLYYNMSVVNKLQLFFYYGTQFVKNPAYLNRSLLDSFTGFASYYMLPQDYIQFFDFIPWEQKEIENIILNQYGWEKAKDTQETWRIGDGTASFYNHIYYKLAGFTEFDTFKSNQIREGMITREEAMKELYQSNQGRLESFLWYCDTINIDPLETLKIIDSKRPLYVS